MPMRAHTMMSVLITLLALATVCVPSSPGAQPAGKVWRIGRVLLGTPQAMEHLGKVIESSLAAAGYVHGRNITLAYKVAPPEPAAAEDVLRAMVPTIDLLIVGSTIGAVAARKVTTTLPTVFLSVGDPVRIGLVSSLARPGGNMTGVTFEAASETYGKRLQLLKEIVPGLTTVGVLRTLGDANTAVAMESLTKHTISNRSRKRSRPCQGSERRR